MTIVSSVTGTIDLPSDVPAGATIYVRVEDVSQADAAALVVAERKHRVTARERGGTKAISFTVPVKGLTPNASYSVRVHVDVDGDGEVSRGDYITTQSYPVLTHGHSNRVEIALRRV